MKTLIIHHLEPEWSHGYLQHGTTFAQLCEKFAQHLDETEYDQVILTQFNYTRLDEAWPYEPLIGRIDQQHEYGYGYEIDSFINDDDEREDAENTLESCGEYVTQYGVKLCNGGNHSSVLPIDDWMMELKRKNSQVFISGAFDGECIEDLECVLKHIGIDFNRIESLII